MPSSSRSWTFTAGTVLAAGILAAAAPTASLAGAGHKRFAFGHPGKAAQVSRVVRLVASDVKFDRQALRFRVGETVKFVVVNTGEGDHEMTIGDNATQVAHRREMEKAMENGGISHHGHGHPNATYLKPGRTTTLIWTFSKPGAFEFGCNIPGHYEAGMKGRIIVRR
jgi:uncharacterized cupredoxin-like copper-binding protein